MTVNGDLYGDSWWVTEIIDADRVESLAVRLAARSGHEQHVHYHLPGSPCNERCHVVPGGAHA